jgi:hypothetical protein
MAMKIEFNIRSWGLIGEDKCRERLTEIGTTDIGS